MFGEKDFLGTVDRGNDKINYYLLKKNYFYGVEIEEETNAGITYEGEYFTEHYEEAYKVGIALREGQVTLTTMINILDDYIQ